MGLSLYILSSFIDNLNMSANRARSREDESQKRHGIQYLPREKQPSMFDILSWEHDPLKSKDWLIKMRSDYYQPKFTEPQVYERPQKLSKSRQKNEISNSRKQKNNGKHQIKHELYYYGDDKPVDAKEKSPKVIKKESKPVEKKKKEKVRLNQFNEYDKRQIEIRKQNIKGFKYYTRELPDSAFTTYFGKPAFANYGSAADQKSITRHKSHSVMPHAGKNHPQSMQSHAGALNKANVINLQPRIPKVSTELPPEEPCTVKLSQYYNVEIVKPDLINEVRFSNVDKNPKLKEKTPSHKDLNYIPKREYPPPLHVGDKNPKKKQIRAKTEQKQDGLAFMNRRQKFIKDVFEKKKTQSRLAYKVTECYPLDWDNETQANSTARQNKWNQVRPAGVTSAHYLSAQSPFLTH